MWVITSSFKKCKKVNFVKRSLTMFWQSHDEMWPVAIVALYNIYFKNITAENSYKFNKYMYPPRDYTFLLKKSCQS